jgi:mRNA interferase MazF
MKTPTSIQRGDVVVASPPSSRAKPRPYLVLQSNRFDEHASVTVLPLVSELHPAPLFRLTVEPLPGTGLRVVSQIAVDKIVTIPRDKLGKRIGALDSDTMARVTRSIALWLGIA